MVSAKKGQKTKNRKTKLFIAFDEDARREYLTGFRKRKKERQQKAKQNMEEKLKEERRQIRKEKRQMFQSMARDTTIPEEIKHLVDPEVYNMDKHTVTVTDISEVDLSGQDGLRLGLNKTTFEDKKEEKVEEDETNAKGKQYNEEKLRHRIKKANDLQQRLKAKQKKKHKPRAEGDSKSRKDKKFNKKKKK